MRGVLKDSSFFVRTISLILVFLFFSLLGIVIGVFFAGDDFNDISAIRILQLTQSVFTFVIPPFVLAYLWSDKPVNYLQLNRPTQLKAGLLVILFMLLIIPFINLITNLNERIVLPDFLSSLEEILKSKELETQELIERLLNVNTVGALIFNIFLISVLPAVGEELFFRGTIQRMIQDWRGGALAVWISAFIFSVAHFQFYGFIPRLLLGALLGYLFLWSKNLWIPIIAHFVNNFVVIIYYYVQNNGFKLIDLDAIGSGETWWIGVLSGIIFISGFVYFKKYFSDNTKTKKSYSFDE